MSKKLRIIFLAILFLNLFLLGNNTILEAIDSGEEVARLIVGETRSFSTTKPTRVVIGNPQVADIAEVSDTEITVSAKSPGTTTLIFWDLYGEQSVKIRVFTEDLNEIKRRIDNILDKLNLSEVYSKVEEEEGKVFVLGRVKKSQDRERIMVALGALKEKIVDLIEVREEEAVVEIDVQVLEVDHDATKTLGFTMPGAISVAEPATRFSKAMRASMDALFHVFDWPRSDFSARLDALVQEGKVRILSRPRVSCQSGKEAELSVGGEKPIFATYTTQTGTGATVEYKEYGIKLKIKPTVTEAERIKLALNVEVSETGDVESIGSTSETKAKAYPLRKRTASTELFLNDGQTLAIGGLIKRKTEEDVRKTAGLGDIPIIGLFFRNKTTKLGGGQGERGNTELFIILTPTIISPEGIKQVKEGVGIRPEMLLSPGGPSGGEGPLDPVATYSHLIQRRILANLMYPPLAKEAGFQGTVRLGLRLSSSGALLEVKVEGSSGYKLLDNHALKVTKKLSPYPPFPSSINLKELWIDIPIVYRLDQN